MRAAPRPTRGRPTRRLSGAVVALLGGACTGSNPPGDAATTPILGAPDAAFDATADDRPSPVEDADGSDRAPLAGPVGAARCEAATLVEGNETPALADVATASAPGCGDAGTEGGPVAWLRTSVPAGRALHVRAGAEAAPGLVRLYAGCGAGACLTRGGPGPDGSAEFWWINPDPASRDVVYAIGAASPGGRPPSVFSQELVPVAAGRTCSTATALTPGTPAVDTYLEGGAERPPSCGGELPRPSLWYRVRVPSRQRLTALSLLAGTTSPDLTTLRAYRACGGECLVPDRGRSLSALQWTNPGPDADVLLAVSPDDGRQGSSFEVRAHLSTVPAYVDCARARPLDEATPLNSDDTAEAVAPAPACAGPSLSNAYFYRATIPAGRELVATARGVSDAMPAPVVAVLPACDAATCLATSAAGAHSVATVRYANPGAAPLDVVLAVATPAGSPTLFTPTADAHVPATNGRCASPLRLSDGAALAAQRPVDAREAPRGCASATALGPALYYAVRVGAGEQLTVSARGEGHFVAPRLALLDGCAASACLAEDASREGLPAASLVWTNEGPAARDLVLAMAAHYGASSGQRVSVAASVRRPDYRVEPAPAPCDDMTGSTPVPIVTSYLGSTEYPLHEMPFAFAFFGEPVRYWTAGSGQMQLWTSPDSRAAESRAVALPSLLAPSRIVAPLWSALTFDWHTAIRSRVIDGPRRRLTLQWTVVRPTPDWRTLDPVTFQAWLLEGGAIEFHYCSMTTAASAGASIGIQGGAVTRGVSYAYDRAGAVATGDGLRFVPSE